MSAVIESQALTDLYARAGSSDADREAWLAERRNGVTATELRDIMIAPDRERAIRELVKKKREGDLFAGNAYTQWGNEREPIIARWLAGYGVIPESRVFHAEANSRHLMSPDGISEDWDGRLVLDEIKTCGHALPMGSDDLAKKGYVWQMQWGCYVLDAIGCHLTVEIRLGTPRSGFEPGERTREFFPRDDAMIAQLIEVADLVLAAMDADPVPEVIDEELDTHAVNYLRAIDEEKRWGDLKREHYAAVVAAGKSQESPLARVTYTAEKPGEVLDVVVIDEEAARAARMDLWAKVHAARQKHAAVEREWVEHLAGFTTVTKEQGKGRAASARITAGKGTKA